MHAVFGNGVHAYRLEGPGTHVQRQPGDFDGTCGELPEQRIVEMQAGGRRSHGAGLAGKNGLVARFVVAAGGVGDVGWQR